MRRRQFIKTGLLGSAAVLAGCAEARRDLKEGYDAGRAAADGDARDVLYTISLAQWSLHKAIFAGELDPLDFPVISRDEFAIDGIEYVNGLFTDRRTDEEYLTELRNRCDGAGVQSLLIMCDGEGRIGDPDENARTQTIDNHRRWLDAASFLGCHSIRVNASSEGDWETQKALAADGLRRLTEVAAEQNLNVIVENHGGISSNGQWLAEVMQAVDHPRCGTLPDFGNWHMGDALGGEYDPYEGTEELMPFAKAVSFKTHRLAEDPGGPHFRYNYATQEYFPVDFDRLMRLTLDAGYRDWVGIEYEGSDVDEITGIKRSKAILEHLHETLKSDYS
ncbi:MAG: sugar phosphate isomerase/epimerase [Rhodothermales bacterium]|nr:sugar phosphate isomerase/epimerase [Rhodothermales bacterium]MBO6778738.1 sugar phosphate isomerase/epimerase [Rhodothermales bacterium]